MIALIVYLLPVLVPAHTGGADLSHVGDLSRKTHADVPAHTGGADLSVDEVKERFASLVPAHTGGAGLSSGGAECLAHIVVPAHTGGADLSSSFSAGLSA